MGAYVDYTLGNLVSEELEGSGVKVELESKPIFEGILPYAVKYRETSWQFLSRMAALCGEWFYYDGQKLVLPNPKREKSINSANPVRLHQEYKDERIEYYKELIDANPSMKEWEKGWVKRANSFNYGKD